MPTTTQIRCPFCNAAHVQNDSGQYICEFCLQPFSVVQAAKEEARLLAEIKAWVDQKLGPAGSNPGAVDASSRAFIFQQKILPALKRDVDRSLEALGAYSQHALVETPVGPVGLTTRGNVAPNPLVVQRAEILGLKNLRARLADGHVSAFAVADADKGFIQTMDRRLAELLFLSNVAEAAARHDEQGYVTARRNLESLIDEVAESLKLESADAALCTFLGALQERYRNLAELCRVCEELSSPNAVAAAPVAERADGIATRLRAIAREIEKMDYSPADSMPVVIGVDQEAQSCELLARWLHSYGTIAGRSEAAFSQFVAELQAVLGSESADDSAELLVAAAQVVRAARGEVAVGVASDIAWVDSWVEASRARKSLGLFGVDEKVSEVTTFLVPVWVAEVGVSQASGAIFVNGVESKLIGVVDACAPSAGKVRFFKSEQAEVRPLLSEAGLPCMPVALPRSTAAGAQAVFQQAIKQRPEFLNGQVKVRGLAFVGAAVASFDSKRGAREVANAWAGALPVDPSARLRVEALAQVRRVFG